jgi:hypothetical protein
MTEVATRASGVANRDRFFIGGKWIGTPHGPVRPRRSTFEHRTAGSMRAAESLGDHTSALKPPLIGIRRRVS